MAILVALAAACGRSGPAHHSTGATHSSTVCLPQARAAVARSLALPTAAVASAESVGNNAEPQCTFSARLSDAKRVTVVANVDSSAQPYFRLERTYLEAEQVFTPTRLIPAPEAITGLGLEADWFPAQSQLMTTDGLRLITVSVSWPGATQKHEQAVAEIVARPYLRSPHR